MELTSSSGLTENISREVYVFLNPHWNDNRFGYKALHCSRKGHPNYNSSLSNDRAQTEQAQIKVMKARNGLWINHSDYGNIADIGQLGFRDAFYIPFMLSVWF